MLQIEIYVNSSEYEYRIIKKYDNTNYGIMLFYYHCDTVLVFINIFNPFLFLSFPVSFQLIL